MKPPTENALASPHGLREQRPPRLGRSQSPAQTELVRVLAQIAVSQFLEECTVEGDGRAVPCDAQEDQ